MKVEAMEMATYRSITGLTVNVSYERCTGPLEPHLHCSIGRVDRLPSSTEIELVSTMFAPMRESIVLKSYPGTKQKAPFVWHVLISIFAPVVIGSN